LSDKKRLIDWVNWKLKSWGFAKRKLLCASENYPESMMGRLIEEGPGASLSGMSCSRDLEVFRGDALEAAVAIHRALAAHEITERQLEALFVHYVIEGPVKQKIHAMRIASSNYYDTIARAHSNLAIFF
jgi:hypothetical protein